MNDRELEIYKDVFNPEESDLDYFLRRQKEMREGKVTPEEEFYIKDLTEINKYVPLSK